MNNYIGFQCDYSDQGTLEVTMEVLNENRAAGGKKPVSTSTDGFEFEEIKALVPLWLLLAEGQDKREVIKHGTHFVSCRVNGMGFEIFIEKSEFEKLIPKKYPGLDNIYDRDYEKSEVNDALDCVGYDVDSIEIGTSGAHGWPRGEFVPHTKLDPMPRYHTQAAIWRSIITNSTTAGSSRLWEAGCMEREASRDLLCSF
ncbi:hypothetical protein RhiJN_18294 [Ceratobasidium sp. AG-Ba]|nr:hypothetical protein RhiJN_18294 [Ceratobasidium sp. AG-Ba]